MKEFTDGIERIKKEGGQILHGGKIIEEKLPGNYVYPTIVEIDSKAPVLKDELFVPIMYLIKVKSLEEAIEVNNSVPQGLSSSIFTRNLKHLFRMLGPVGSDCGIINCNMGTSGAEIGCIPVALLVT